MKRESCAIALLLVLLVGSLWNIRCLDRRIDAIEYDLRQSMEAADSGDFESARRHFDTALDTWLKADSYTHIFIRHSEIDSTSDAFYELMELLAKDDAEGSPSAYLKLLYHLESIDQMDHLRLGSIL